MPKFRASQPLVFTVTAMLLVVLAVFLLFKTQLVNELLFDSRDHGLTCAQLPSAEEVERVMEQSTAVIHQINQVNPGLVMIQIDTANCRTKADLVISYGSHRDRQKVAALIKGSALEHLPTRWHNQ